MTVDFLSEPRPAGLNPSASASQVAEPTSACYHNKLMFLFFVDPGSCFIAHAGLKLLPTSDPLTQASQSDGITGMNHCALPCL